MLVMLNVLVSVTIGIGDVIHNWYASARVESLGDISFFIVFLDLLYIYVNNDIYNALPSDLKELIIDTKVVSGHGSTTGESNFVTTDKLYLLATREIWENGEEYQIEYDTARELTRQLDYYKKLGVTTDKYEGAIKLYNGSAYYWWLRSPYSHYSDTFYPVNDIGGWTGSDANNGGGLVVAFRL